MDDSDCISYGSLADSMEMRSEQKTELEKEGTSNLGREERQRQALFLMRTPTDKNKPSEETDSKPSTNERKPVRKEAKSAAAGDQSIQVEGVQTQAAGGGGGRRELGLYEAMEQRRKSKEIGDRGEW